jgi:hypothetical protein
VKLSLRSGGIERTADGPRPMPRTEGGVRVA